MPLTKARLVNWTTPNDPLTGRRPYREWTEEEYMTGVKSHTYGCEYMAGLPCRVYLDWDKKVPIGDCYGADMNYLERNEMRSIKEQIADAIRKAPLLSNQPYGLLTRKPRLVEEGKKVKFSYRIIFTNLITKTHTIIPTYLKACGYENDKPFDLSPYDENRIINAVYCSKKTEPEAGELLPYYKTDINLSNLLITMYDDTLPMIDWDKWMPKTESIAVVKKEVKVIDNEDEALSIRKVKALLSCISSACDYTQWLEILMAVKSVLGDSDDAYTIADEWSATADNYDARVFGRTWNSIKDLGKYTIGTLVFRAKNENAEKFKTEFADVFKRQISFDDIHTLRDYNKIKEVFETRICKITDAVRFIYKCDMEPIQIKSRKDLKETYENIIYVCEGKEGKKVEKSFIDKWLKDPKMLEYKSAMNLPPPLVAPPNTLNLWTPYTLTLKSYDTEPEGEFDTFEKHLFLLCGKSQECAEHTMKTLAYKLQFPAYKTRMMMIFVGAEGTGKNLFFDILKKLFGADKCFSTPNVGRKLFGDFSHIWADKQIVVLNDFNPAEVKKENSEKLKDYITETDITLEKKNVNEFEGKQYAHFIAFSQSYTPVANNSGSRRFFQMECATDEVGNQAYFTNLVQWMEKEGNIWTLFKKLVSMDLTDFDPSKFPITEVSLMAKMANASPIEAFIEERKREIVRIIQYKKMGERGFILNAKKEEQGIFKVFNHRGLFNTFKAWAYGNLPDYQNYTMRKFQLEMYRLRLRYGLEFKGDEKHPERSFWKITQEDKWALNEEEGEEDEEQDSEEGV